MGRPRTGITDAITDLPDTSPAVWLIGPTMMPRRLTQPARLAIAAIYVLVLGVVAVLLFGGLPPFGLAGMWLYAAAAAILLGSALVEPHYTRPSDAVANGLALLLGVAAVDHGEAAVAPELAGAGRVALMVYGVLVIAAGVLAIAWKDAAGRRKRWATELAVVLRQAGRATWVFSLLYFTTVWAAFADRADAVFVLCATWALIFGAAPVERLVGWRWRMRRDKPLSDAVVESLEDPQLVELRLMTTHLPKIGWRAEFGDLGIVGYVVSITQLLNPPRALIALPGPVPLSAGDAVSVAFSASEVPIVGYVAAQTTIDELVVLTASTGAAENVDRTQVASGEPPLREGVFLRTTVHGREALYQVIGAEVVRTSGPGAKRAYVEVHARKLGCWSSTEHRFVPIAWLPRPGTPVFLQQEDGAAGPKAELWVGSVPGTGFGAAYDVHGGVTHNTAILGVLGSGKTTLAWELIGRMLADKVKVLVLDISGHYRPQFEDLVSPEQDAAIHDEISAKIAAGVSNLKVVNGEAGNVADFRDAVHDLLRRFVDGESRLLILNPLRFDVTNVDIKGFDEGKRTLRRISSVEVTRIVSEELLALLRDRVEFDERKARVCLVLEEAHSLVPEWNSAAEKSEEHAAIGTVRAILQGRKYGFGCLLITQRTANVTKSILNQCNTIFALQVFDATGMEFLQNYIGRTHARLLASLQSRQAVIFGRAFRSTAPLVVDLNHRTDAFIPQFWAEAAKGVPETRLVGEAEATVTDVSDAPESTLDGEWDPEMDQGMDEDSPF